MKAFFKISIPFLLAGLASFFLGSCTKEAESPKVLPPTAATLSTPKATYAPFEVVTIKTPKNALGASPFDAQLNGQKVRVYPTDTVAVFVMPDVANGPYTLTLTANSVAYSLNITALALITVLSPEVYFTALETQMNRNLAAITAQADAVLQSGGPAAEGQALKQNAQQYAALFGTYKTAYQNLSPSDKLNFARAMAANKADDDAYEGLAAAAAGQANALRGTQAVTNYEAGVDASMKAFKALVIFTVAHIPFIVAEAQVLAAAPNPFMAVVLGGTIASFLVHATLARSTAGTLLNKSLKPFQGLGIDQTSYGSGTDVPVNVSVDYESLTPADETTGTRGSILDAGLAKYKSFREAFNNLASQLPAPLQPTAIVSVLKAQASTLSRAVHNSYVRISNLSNPAVTLTPLNQADGSLKVRATTTAATTQNFSYDLAYVNTGFSPGLTKRVAAQVVISTAPMPCMTEPELLALTNGSFTTSGSKQWHVLNITSPTGYSLSYNASVSPCKVSWTLSHAYGSPYIVVNPDAYGNGFGIGGGHVLCCYNATFNSFTFGCSPASPGSVAVSILSLSPTHLILNNGAGYIFTFEPY